MFNDVLESNRSIELIEVTNIAQTTSVATLWYLRLVTRVKGPVFAEYAEMGFVVSPYTSIFAIKSRVWRDFAPFFSLLFVFRTKWGATKP